MARVIKEYVIHSDAALDIRLSVDGDGNLLITQTDGDFVLVPFGDARAFADALLRFVASEMQAPDAEEGEAD